MGTNASELKKIHELDLDDYVDDATLARIRKDLDACDASIRAIAARPAFEGETQLAVNRALAQLQAEVRKWHKAVGAIESERTAARDSMRAAKPKYDDLPKPLGNDESGATTVAIEKSREEQAAKALRPMDAKLSTCTAALRSIDLSRPAFDPDRQVDQRSIKEQRTLEKRSIKKRRRDISKKDDARSVLRLHKRDKALHPYDAGSSTTYTGGPSGAYGGDVSGSSGAVGDGASVHNGAVANSGNIHGPGSSFSPQTAGADTEVTGSAADWDSGSRIVANPDAGHSGSVAPVDRFTSSANGVTAEPSSAYVTERYTLQDGRLVPLTFSSPGASGGGSVGVGNAGLVAGAAGTAAAAAAAVTAAKVLGGGASAAASSSAAAGTTAAAGVSGSTGMAAAATGATTQGAGRTGSTGIGGRPVAGAPAGGHGTGQSRSRRRPRNTHDIPLLENKPQEEHVGDPGPAGQAGSRDALPSPQWTRESDTW